MKCHLWTLKVSKNEQSLIFWLTWYADYEYVVIGQRPIFWLGVHRSEKIMLKNKTHAFIEEDLNDNANVKVYLFNVSQLLYSFLCLMSLCTERPQFLGPRSMLGSTWWSSFCPVNSLSGAPGSLCPFSEMVARGAQFYTESAKAYQDNFI